jgi:hypothetical protein
MFDRLTELRMGLRCIKLKKKYGYKYFAKYVVRCLTWSFSERFKVIPTNVLTRGGPFGIEGRSVQKT